jgi:ABC-type nitrate/sulfonate/bicarbonate transport system substrate-binding protein
MKRTLTRSLSTVCARIIALVALVVAVQALPTASAAPATPIPATLNLGVFATNIPLLAAQQKGFFTAQQLAVNILPVSSSTQQFQYLRDGQYDMVSTSPDNVLNYRLNTSNALKGTFGVQIIGGTQYAGNLSLIGQPGMTSLADFRGKAMAVDSASSGFAYVLYRMLENAGLVKDVDYTVVPCGGGTQRFNALLTGTCVVNGTTYTIDGGALLNGLQVFNIQQRGYPVLQSIQEAAGLDPYLGGVFAATEPWLAAHEDEAVRFLAALAAATDWALDPANRDEAIALLVQSGASQFAAEQQYLLETTPGVGLIPGLSIDRDALRTVIELRADFNGFDTPQNISYLTAPASGLYDTSYLKQAEKLLKQQGK